MAEERARVNGRGDGDGDLEMVCDLCNSRPKNNPTNMGDPDAHEFDYGGSFARNEKSFKMLKASSNLRAASARVASRLPRSGSNGQNVECGERMEEEAGGNPH